MIDRTEPLRTRLDRFGVRLYGALLASVTLLVIGVGCSTPQSLIEKAETGGRYDRADALEALTDLAQRGRLDRATPEVRERLDGYIARRFSVEPNPTLRAQLIAIALEAELPCAAEILRSGFDDPELAVRLQAVERIEEIPPIERRERLRRRLVEDDDPLVQIAAARAYRSFGTEDWARELVEVIVDPNHDENVRFQAYLSAVELTGADLMFLPEDWRAWLEENSS